MKKEKPLLRVGGSDSYMDIPTHSASVYLYVRMSIITI